MQVRSVSSITIYMRTGTTRLCLKPRVAFKTSLGTWLSNTGMFPRKRLMFSLGTAFVLVCLLGGADVAVGESACMYLL